VIASNTSTVGKDAFSSEQDLRDPKLNTSAFSASGELGAEPAEEFAMFGKEFLKAIGSGRVDPTTNENEIRRR
ncbi:MAG: hypothetical protein V4692_15045, partial [Bdellovibrionota bacterium]